MKYDYRKLIRREAGMNMKCVLLAAFLIAQFSFLICPAGAQGMVTEIKVIAIHYDKDLAGHSVGYNGGNNFDLDFRKGRGGGYVFALSKNAPDTARYITDVKVTADRGLLFGKDFEEGGKMYTTAVFYQEMGEHYDKDYKGGLNGRNYSIYGGAYQEQPHVYVSRTGNTKFSNKVLRDIYVTTTKPTNLKKNQTWSGPHAGGKRYFVYTWHTHEPKFRPIVNDSTPKGNIQQHIRYCDTDQCGVEMKEPHRFPKLYDKGADTWMIVKKTGTEEDTLIAKYHYKKCSDCGQLVYEPHKWATYTADWLTHNKRCLTCDFVIEQDHVDFGKQKLPVDDYYHMIYCGCGFIKKLHHQYSDDHTVKKEDCEQTIIEYTCKQCFHQARFEAAGKGHQYNAAGICTRKGCIHPYQQPGVERTADGKDSVFVVKNYGNLYWVSDYVNNRRPKTNVRLDNDLIADTLIAQSWRPIGATDSTAYQGTFDGGGHVITMLQTETPVAGTGYRGLFGIIGKQGTVKNVVLAACNMRGWNYIGGVAGVNEGTIDKCRVAFSIMNTIGTGMNLGGICGLNRGSISNCTTDKDVWVGGVRDYAGGICGTNAGGTLSNNQFEAICGSGSDAQLQEFATQQ